MRTFSDRHIGISSTDEKAMLDFLGLENLDHLIEQTIPKEIINNGELKLDKAISEFEDSNAGGHIPAAGAAFPIKYLEKFKSNLIAQF